MLTVACEHGDPGMIVSGRPEPSRWYLGRGHGDRRRAHLPVLGPEAYVPVETRAITPLPWRPAARQRVKGLACEAKATEPGAHAFNFYAFPNDGQPRPTFAPSATRRLRREAPVALARPSVTPHVAVRRMRPCTKLNPRLRFVHGGTRRSGVRSSAGFVALCLRHGPLDHGPWPWLHRRLHRRVGEVTPGVPLDAGSRRG